MPPRVLIELVIALILFFGTPDNPIHHFKYYATFEGLIANRQTGNISSHPLGFRQITEQDPHLPCSMKT